jgi:hypothetical protein
MPSAARSLAAAAVTLISVAALPTAALAQQRLDPVHVTAEQSARADALHAKAEQYAGSLRAYRKVARLHEEAAALRPSNDPQAFDCLRTAALLRYYSNDRRGGADAMERAAELATLRGDVIGAANAYIDAAVIAGELRQGPRMTALVEKADLLTTSPLLSDAQRLELRGRITRGTEVARLDRP